MGEREYIVSGGDIAGDRVAVFSGVGDELVDSPSLGGAAERETIMVAVCMLASSHQVPVIRREEVHLEPLQA